MVCNADEGDGGAWVNRMTLETDPHALIEGMMIGGWATGAARGYIYIREEYPLAFERVVNAVAQATQRGILGTNILGTDFNFDIKVVRGAGSYVCGEESGLIASIEDGRGMPKIRPPFPAGVRCLRPGQQRQQRPELPHRRLPPARRHGEVGGGRHRAQPRHDDVHALRRRPARRLLRASLRHHRAASCTRSAAAARPRATPSRRLQPGGPLTRRHARALAGLCRWSRRSSARTRWAPSAAAASSSWTTRDCIVDLCAHFEWFLEDESCGRCTTCHGGTQRIVEILRRIQRGGGRESDIGKFRLLADTLRYSNCFHGQATPAIIVNMLDWFADELNEHINNKRCPARTCKGLIRYEVDQAAAPAHEPALAKAYDYCPTGAVKQIDGQYVIEDSLCIRCDVCRQLAPEAIRKADAFDSSLGPAPELISVQPASFD